MTSRLGTEISKSFFYGVGTVLHKGKYKLFQEHIKEYLERLATSEQQGERGLLKWNLILADRDDIIASLKVRHFYGPECYLMHLTNHCRFLNCSVFSPSNSPSSHPFTPFIHPLRLLTLLLETISEWALKSLVSCP